MPNWKKVIVSGSAAEITTLKATSLSGQSSEQTSLMINSSGVVGTRELGSNAFNSNTYNNYSLPAGSSSTRGGFKIGFAESGRNYPVEVSSEKMYVNVPWVDTNSNTTYSAGSGISQTGTVFSNSGVLSLTAGDNVSLSASTGIITISSTDTNTNTQLTTAQVRGKISASGNSQYNATTGVITSTNTNTQLSDAQVRSKFTGGTNVSISATGVISSTDTNTDTNTQRSDGEIRDVTAAQLEAGDNVTLVTEGERIIVSSTDTNTDTNTTYSAGGGLTLSGTTFSHTDTSARSSINNSGRTYIQDVTLDTYGHVTGLASATETVVNTDTNTQLSDAQVRSKFTGGTNVSITSGGVISSTDTNTNTQRSDAEIRGVTAAQLQAGDNVTLLAEGENIIISSTDTNTNTQLTTAQVRGKFSGTGINTSTGVITNTNTQLSDAQVRSKFTGGTNVAITSGGVISSTNTNTQRAAGGGLTLSGNTLSHTDTSSQSSVNNSGRTYIQDVTLDTYGHVTGLASATETVVNTNTNTQRSDGEIRDVTAAQLEAGDNVTVTTEGERIIISSTDTNTNTQLSTAQVRGKISGTGLIGYNSSTGVISTTANNITNNTQITNGAGYQTSTQVNAAIATVVDSAPAALNTLNELAAALGDDADFAGSVTTALAGKLSTSGKAADSNLLDGLDLHTGRNNVANRVVRTNGSGYADFGWINTTSGTASGTLTRIYCSQDDYLRYLTPSSFLSSMGIAAGATNVTNNSQISNGRGYITSYTDTNTQRSDGEIRGVTAAQLAAGDNVTLVTEGENIIISSTDTNTNTQLSTAQVRAKFSGTGINTSTGVITNTNTQLSDAQVRSKFSGGTNVSISATGVISSTDTNTDTNTQRSDEEIRDVASAQWINGTNTTVVKSDSGNTIKINSVDTNTWRGIHDSPVNGSTTTSISSNWAFDNVKTAVPAGALFTDTNTNTQRAAGGGLTLSGNTLSHTDTSSQSSVNNSGRTYIQDVTLDTYGHVTGLASATETVVNTNTNTQRSDGEIRDVTAAQLEAGDNVTVTTEGERIIISSTDTNTDTNTQLSTAQVRAKFSGTGINTSTGVITNTNTQLSDAQVRSKFTGGTNVSINSSGVISSTDTNTNTFRTVRAGTNTLGATEILSFTAGENVSISESGGEVIITSTDTNTDTNTQRAAGGGLTLSGNTLSHTDTSSQGSVNNSGRTYIQDVTLDGYGHVTGLASATETVVNTNTNTQRSDGEIRNVTAAQLVAGDNVTLQTEGENIIVNSTYTNTNTQLSTAQVRAKFSGTGINTSTGVITNTNTQLSDAQVRSKFSAGTNVSISATGVISSTDTNTDTNTTYSADGNYGMTLSGTAFRLENDRRRNSTSTDIYTGNTHDFTWYDASVGIRWYTAGSEEMRLLDNGTLHVDGDVVAYSTTVSDKRLKDNVTTIENPLDKIKALRGVEYDWNTGNRKGKHDLGLIAQEVESVIPEIVHEHTLPLMDNTDTLYKTVDYEKMVAVLIEGMKEQQTQIESLQSEIQTIKGKL